LLLTGFSSQAEIAREFNVSKQTIVRDVQLIRRQWNLSAIRNFDEAQAVELRKLDRLEAEYWASWEASKTPKVTVKTLRDGSIERTEEHGPGHVRFLDGVLACITKRCALLGLDEHDMIERARQRAAQNAQTVNLQVNIASLTVVDLLQMAEKGEPIPKEALASLAPQDLIAVHRKLIEGA